MIPAIRVTLLRGRNDRSRQVSIETDSDSIWRMVVALQECGLRHESGEGTRLTGDGITVLADKDRLVIGFGQLSGVLVFIHYSFISYISGFSLSDGLKDLLTFTRKVIEIIMKKQKETCRLAALMAFYFSVICLGGSCSRFIYDGESYFFTEDISAWMEVADNSENLCLIAHVRNTVDAVADTLALGHEMLGVYPKGVYAVDGTDGDTRLLFIYSRGNIFFWDGAVVYVAGKDGPVRRGGFQVENTHPDEVDVMWWDPRVDACNGFPPDLDGFPDNDKHGIRFDPASKRLYVPVMDYHEDDEFDGCPIYTGRYSVLEFNGNEFVYIGED